MCITPAPNSVMFVGESTYPGGFSRCRSTGRCSGSSAALDRELNQFWGAHAAGVVPREPRIYVR